MHFDAGGVLEISRLARPADLRESPPPPRWWSEAEPPEPAPAKESAPEGAAESRDRQFQRPFRGARLFSPDPVVALVPRFTTG